MHELNSFQICNSFKAPRRRKDAKFLLNFICENLCVSVALFSRAKLRNCKENGQL